MSSNCLPVIFYPFTFVSCTEFRVEISLFSFALCERCLSIFFFFLFVALFPLPVYVVIFIIVASFLDLKHPLGE